MSPYCINPVFTYDSFSFVPCEDICSRNVIQLQFRGLIYSATWHAWNCYWHLHPYVGTLLAPISTCAVVQDLAQSLYKHEAVGLNPYFSYFSLFDFLLISLLSPCHLHTCAQAHTHRTHKYNHPTTTSHIYVHVLPHITTWTLSPPPNSASCNACPCAHQLMC